MRYRFVLLIALLAICKSCLAQDEFVSWTGVNFIYPIDEKIQITLLPIHRRNQDFTSHQNSSYDLIVKMKASERWSFQALQRTFFVPDNFDQYVVFLDINYHFKPWGKFKFKNGFRYHLGIDVNNPQADMLRWRPILTYPLGKNLNIFVGHDWFYRFNGINKMWQVRYQAGLNKKFSDKLALNLQYWKQNQLNREFRTGQNMFILYLNYILT